LQNGGTAMDETKINFENKRSAVTAVDQTKIDFENELRFYENKFSDELCEGSLVK